jgi:hypothetical protein
MEEGKKEERKERKKNEKNPGSIDTNKRENMTQRTL